MPAGPATPRSICGVRSPSNPTTARRCAPCPGPLFAVGLYQEGVDLALRALVPAPQDAAAAIHACELLMRCERIDEAAAIIEAVADATANATALRVLSGVEMVRDRPQPALAAIDRAVALVPHCPEYHL